MYTFNTLHARRLKVITRLNTFVNFTNQLFGNTDNATGQGNTTTDIISVVKEGLEALVKIKGGFSGCVCSAVAESYLSLHYLPSALNTPAGDTHQEVKATSEIFPPSIL